MVAHPISARRHPLSVVGKKPMKGLFRTISDAMHRPSSPLYSRVEGTVWVLILLWAGLFVQEVLWGRSGPFGVWLNRLDYALLWVFIVEIVVRVVTYTPASLAFYERSGAGRLRLHILGRMRFLLTPAMLIDLLAVLAILPIFRGLRALRLLRLLRTRRLLLYSNPFTGLARAFEENALLFGFAFSLFGFAVVLGGITITLIEMGANPAISSLQDGMWWALVTLTTVGFGDITPVTAQGRLVGGALMIGGMITLALFAGIVGQTMMSSVLTIRQEQFRMRSTVNHIVLCGLEEGTWMVLAALGRELDLTNNTVVVFAPGVRPAELPPEFQHVSGDPTKESELHKVRIRFASKVIIAGSRQVSPQHADANTLLTCFTIRRFVKENPLSERRASPLYIVAEILDAENVEHARTAGADEVIESTKVGFALVAHAVRFPGTASTLSGLVNPTGHSLFVGRVPESVELPADFRTVASGLKETLGVMVIGVRTARPTEDLVNPPEERQVQATDRVLYLASEPVMDP